MHSFSRFIRLGVGSLLGFVFPRNTETPPAVEDQAANEANALEIANARIRELEGISAERIRAEAESLVAEIFPAVAAPEGGDRRAPVREDDQVGGDGEPRHLTTEDRVSHVEQSIEDMRIAEGRRMLEAELERLEGKFPHMNRNVVLLQLAGAHGDVNLEKLAEVNHNTMLRTKQEFHEAEMRRLSENPPPRPPPIPGNPTGTPVPGEPKMTRDGAIKKFVQGLSERWKVPLS